MFADPATGRAHGKGVDPDELERMVQDAADQAGGALWRRALAGAAMDELGIPLAEALTHPAVQRAQELLGVPGYEVSRPEPEADPGPPPEPQPPPTLVPAPSVFRVAAVHLAGIEALTAGAGHLELRFSEAGLDVIDTDDGEAIGRLTWDEITVLELPRARGPLRRRRASGPELVIRTDRGQARFGLSGLDDEQVREHLAPVLQWGARGVF
jgi:hypothetical protein